MKLIDNFLDGLHAVYLGQLFGWKSFLYYRLQFIFYLIYAAAAPLASFLFIYVIYHVTVGIPGWSFYQLLFLSGMVGMLSALVPYICSSSGMVNGLRYGYFDLYLTRPYSAFTALMANFSDTTGMMYVVDQLALVIYAGAHLTVTALGVIMTAITFILGTILVVMLFQIIILFSYRVLRSSGVVNNFFNTLTTFAGYPLSLYGFTGTVFLTLVVPIGFATYYPTELFSGKVGVAAFLYALVFSAILIFVFYKIISVKLRGYVSAMG